MPVSELTSAARRSEPGPGAEACRSRADELGAAKGTKLRMAVIQSIWSRMQCKNSVERMWLSKAPRNASKKTVRSCFGLDRTRAMLLAPAR
jgi:hypothetical protein